MAEEQPGAVATAVPDPSPETGWEFAPVRVAAGDPEPPVLLDLTGPEAGPWLDAVDRAAVREAEAEPAVVALWRGWRHGPDGGVPRRILVLGAAPDADAERLPRIADRIRRALAGGDVGEIGDVADAGGEPMVELLPAGSAETGDQLAARVNSALLWTAEPARPLRLARVFDTVDAADGPSFDADHPLVEDADEREHLLTVLGTAPLLLTTLETMPDVLDPDGPGAVPLHFRTDGEWIWTDTVGYYLDRHALAPDPELRAHLLAAAPYPAVSAVALHRALAFLQEPPEVPVWTFPGGDEDGAAEA